LLSVPPLHIICCSKELLNSPPPIMLGLSTQTEPLGSSSHILLQILLLCNLDQVNL
jgi:hypothetical protein